MTAASARRSRSFVLVGFTLLIFIAFAARLWNLGTQSLWHDESWSVFSGYTPFAPMGIRGADVNAPFGYYSTLAAWMRLAGDEVWTMRYLSVLYGVLIVAVAGYIGRRWFNAGVGLLVALLTALSPILWVFSQEIRAYIPLPLATLLLLFLLDYLLRRPSRRVWLALAAVELMALYTQNLSVPLVAWLNLTALLAFIARREWRRVPGWLLVQFGLFLAYLPWLITQRQTGTALNTPPSINLELLWNIWQSYFTGIKALLNADQGLMLLVAGFAFFTATAFVVMLRTALVEKSLSQRVWLLLSQVVFLPIFQLGIIYAAHIDFHPRYFILSVPATLLLTAAFAVRLRVARLGLSLAVGALGIVIFVQAMRVIFSSPIYQHDDFRAIAQRYARLGPEDAIIIPYGWEPTLDYYSRKMHFQAKFIEMPLHGSPEAIMAQLERDLRGVKNAEVLTWFQLPADMRNAYPCLLSAYGDKSDDTLTVSGLQTTRYTDFQVQPDVITSFPGRGTPLFGAVEQSYRWLGAGRQSFCMITRWDLKHPSADDWRIVTRVVNSLGWQMGQTDSLLLSDLQTPTSLWKAGDSGTEFSLIPIPPDAPTDAYSALFSIYSTRTPDGLRTYLPSLPEPLYAGAREAQIGPFKRSEIPAVAAITPDASMTKFSDDLYLRSADIPTGTTLRQGDSIRVILHWYQSRGMLSDTGVPLLMEGDGWKIEATYNTTSNRPLLLSWYQLRVPASATGKITLKIPTFYGTSAVLGTYDVVALDRTFTLPSLTPTAQPNVDYLGIGKLISVVAPQGAINPGDALAVTLLWKANATPNKDYTVFVHLRDKDGNVIAQSDSQPVEGTRPTTTWLAGEYITDAHTLTWNRRDYRGPATLLVGIYDQSTGNRVSLSTGNDFTALPDTITVGR